MSRVLPPLNALRAFEAAGRHESFSRAADELGVSHSAVSRHVRGLEHRLKVRLFRDQPRGVVLTPEGQRYLAYVSPALDQISEATEALHSQPPGVLTVNCEPVFAVKWLVPRLGEFYDRYPEITLRLDVSKELIDVERYEADLAIRFRKTGMADPDAELISDAPLNPFASPELVAQGIRTPQDLTRFRLWRDRTANHWGEWFAQLGDAAPDPEPLPEWHSSAVLGVEAALCGQGVVLAGEDVMLRHVASGELVRCFDLPLQRGAYFLVRRERVSGGRMSRVFQDWLMGATRELRQ